MVKLCLVFLFSVVLCLSCPISATIVDFEALSERQNISGTTRYDIFWESGNPVGSHTGFWSVPDYPSKPQDDYFTYPHSGTKSLTNSWGCTEIGFEFPVETFEYGVAMNGAWFAVNGFVNNWADAVMAKGYKDESPVPVWETSLLSLTTTPQWLAMDERAVDRVVIITTPKEGKTSGGFCMDDLSFEEAIVPEPATLLLLTFGAAFLRRR